MKIKSIKLLLLIPIIQTIIGIITGIFGYIFDTELNYYLSLIITQIFSVFIPLFIVSKFSNTPYIEKNDFKLDTNILVFVILGFSLQIIGMLVNYPVLSLLSSFGFEYKDNLPKIIDIFDFIYAVIAICIVPAVTEEVLFRKYFFNEVSEQSKRMAILITGIFFSVAHFSFYSFLPILITGIVLGILRYYNYSLVYMIICHFALNFSAIIISMLSNKTMAVFDKYFIHFGILFFIIFVYIMKNLLNKNVQMEMMYYKNSFIFKKYFVSKTSFIYFTIFIIFSITGLYL